MLQVVFIESMCNVLEVNCKLKLQACVRKCLPARVRACACACACKLALQGPDYADKDPEWALQVCARLCVRACMRVHACVCVSVCLCLRLCLCL